jgi:hypothetical protein
MKSEMKTEVEEIAELTVRRYFDHFLGETLPTILKTHASSCCTKKLLHKCIWILLGIGIGLSFAFPELLKIIGGLR